jgi:hypothetical protein
MSDFDPRRDPNRMSDDANWEYEKPSSSWGWIIGGLAVVALLLAALTMGRDDTQSTADTGNQPTISRPATPPATTGQAATPNTPAPPATTGQPGSQ